MPIYVTPQVRLALHEQLVAKGLPERVISLPADVRIFTRRARKPNNAGTCTITLMWPKGPDAEGTVRFPATDAGAQHINDTRELTVWPTYRPIELVGGDTAAQSAYVRVCATNMTVRGLDALFDHLGARRLTDAQVPVRCVCPDVLPAALMQALHTGYRDVTVEHPIYTLVDDPTDYARSLRAKLAAIAAHNQYWYPREPADLDQVRATLLEVGAYVTDVADAAPAYRGYVLCGVIDAMQCSIWVRRDGSAAVGFARNLPETTALHHVDVPAALYYIKAQLV